MKHKAKWLVLLLIIAFPIGCTSLEVRLAPDFGRESWCRTQEPRGNVGQGLTGPRRPSAPAPETADTRARGPEQIETRLRNMSPSTDDEALETREFSPFWPLLVLAW